jgi:DNA-binding NtrC family response regulator
MQSKLLRVIPERAVRPLWAVAETPVNVRIVSATHRDLGEEVRAGRFRQDLYYRLNVLRVNMPPLRERGEDVVLLAKFFFEKFAPEKRPHVQGYSKKALQALMEHDWPGNVRELINRVRRAMVMSENRLITPDDLGLANINPTASAQPRLHDARTNVERETLATHLLNARGNLSLAARQMGISRVTLYRLMKKHELQPAR